MINILFTGKNLRQRLRETISNPPQNIKYTTLVNIENMPKDYKLTGKKDNISTSKLNILFLKILYLFRIPNLRYIEKSKCKNIDLIHSPGQLLLNNKDYVIEIDNYLILAFYNIKAFDFFLSKAIIKYYLKKSNCKKLVCISEAAKKSIITAFNDEEITKKCVVVYPYVSKKIVDFIKKDNKIKLLFISSDFYLKGGRETLNVFEKLSKEYNNISLTIITKLVNVDKKILNKYKNSKKVIFIEGNLPKEELYNKYYLKSDIFVMPTYQDSFGLVFLEAISSGLVIITTDMFATTEIVKNNYNGFIVNSPVKYYNEDFSQNKKWFCKNIADYVKENKSEFKSVEKEVYTNLKYLLDNKNKLFEMKRNSYQLYLDKFEDSIRKEKLKKIYENVLK